MTINYSETIPNNVNLSEDRGLQRALDQGNQREGAGVGGGCCIAHVAKVGTADG